jgi:hypothetical protein
LPESVNHSATYTDTQGSPAPSRLDDREFSGEINRASAQGAKFSLLLAMLEQDVLQRPRMLANQDNEQQSAHSKTISALSHYPSIPLKAEAQHWQQATFVSATIHQADIKRANLWLAMHPQPLSLYNDPKRLEDEVVANCDMHAQHRLQDLNTVDIAVDETGLYDILQEMEAQIDTAA